MGGVHPSAQLLKEAIANSSIDSLGYVSTASFTGASLNTYVRFDA